MEWGGSRGRPGSGYNRSLQIPTLSGDAYHWWAEWPEPSVTCGGTLTQMRWQPHGGPVEAQLGRDGAWQPFAAPVDWAPSAHGIQLYTSPPRLRLTLSFSTLIRATQSSTLSFHIYDICRWRCHFPNWFLLVSIKMAETNRWGK